MFPRTFVTRLFRSIARLSACRTPALLNAGKYGDTNQQVTAETEPDCFVIELLLRLLYTVVSMDCVISEVPDCTSDALEDASVISLNTTLGIDAAPCQ